MCNYKKMMMMMIKSRSIFFFLFALLTTVLHVQSSSSSTTFNFTTNSSSSLPFNNIPIGSSIYASSSSTNQTSNSSTYWLSPSGVFAFGFYPLCYNCDQYEVAIWINRPSSEVVVWSNNNNEQPIYAGSSIQLSHDGVFTIHQLTADSTTTTKPLFNHTLEPTAYALMQDTGNFVVYNSDSNILWQSFDHPSDTILQSQTLKPDEKLIVPITGQRLIMQKYGNLELIEKAQHYTITGHTFNLQEHSPKYMAKRRYYLSEDITWQSKTLGKEGDGIVLNLDSTGHMYLVDKDGIVIKNLTKNKASNGSLETTIHRATLESDGVFRLYAERIGPTTHDSDNSVLLWESHCKKCDRHKQMLFKAKLLAWLASAVAVSIVLVCLYGLVIMPNNIIVI